MVFRFGFSVLVFIAVCGLFCFFAEDLVFAGASWFSVFVKSTRRVLDWISGVVFVFFYLGSGSLRSQRPGTDLESRRETKKLYRLASFVQSHVRPDYCSSNVAE